MTRATSYMKNFLRAITGCDSAVILCLGLVQGLLMCLAMEPFGWPLAGWLMPWPLFYLAGRFRLSAPKLVLSGMACAVFFCAFTFYWMIILFGTFAGLGTAASISLFIPFSIVCNLQFPAFVLLFGLSLRLPYRKYLRPRWLTAGLIALAVDYLVPRVFPYCWGNFIAGNLYVAQVADTVGIYGLTFALFVISYFFYRVAGIPGGAFARRNGVGGTLRGLISASALKRLFPVPLMLALCLCYGAIRLAQVSIVQDTLPTVRTAIINPNAPPEDGAYVTRAILDRLMYETIPGLTEQAAQAAGGRLDLVVLPESAVPFMCGHDTPASRKYKKYSPDAELMAQLIAWNWNVDVFLNETSYVYVPAGPGKRERVAYNSSVLYSRDGRRRDSYHKRVLLAFGEYLPGESLLKKIGLDRTVRDIIRSSRFRPGPASNLIAYSSRNRERPYHNRTPLKHESLAGIGPRDFEKKFPADRVFSPEGYFLPLICYESLLPGHVRSFFLDNQGRNPDFIVNITQDGWYGDTSETYQHFELARIRAIETRRALVRAVNDGAAGFVDIAGRHVTALAGPVMTATDASGFQVWDVPVNRDMRTLYVRFGDFWMLIPLLLMALSAAWTGAKSVRNKKDA